MRMPRKGARFLATALATGLVAGPACSGGGLVRGDADASPPAATPPPAAAPPSTSKPYPAPAEILWDTWGVPHIRGGDARAALRAFGWAQARAHADLLLRLYGESRARAAEYWGEAGIASDRWLRTVGAPALARDWYERQTPEFRDLLDAFATGINDYARLHPETIADSVEVVLPVSGRDALAHAQRLVLFDFIVSRQQVAGEARDWAARGGSNAWALAPSHTASGHAMLVANPHLPWSGAFTWFEAHLTAPGLDAYGATWVGLPVLLIAFNADLGWTGTVNKMDGFDLYALELRGDGYRFDGATRPFEVRRDTLRVRQRDGTLRDDISTLRASLHGPIVGESHGGALALRSVGRDCPGVLETFWDLMRARDFAAFRASLCKLQVPFFSLQYAGRDAHIMNYFGGAVPVRPQGGWARWQDVVPGDTSAWLWTRYHACDALPNVIDPPSGWVQNANDPPWTATIPVQLDPADYPADLTTVDMSLRAQRSAKLVMAEPKPDFEALVRRKHSTRSELAERLAGELVAAARRRGTARAKRAAAVLAAWDRDTDADSRGAVLFAAWVDEMEGRGRGGGGLFASPWRLTAPLATPKGLADGRMAVEALDAAARNIETALGRLDVAWGDLYRLRRDGVDLPANGGPHELGIFRSVYFGAPGADGKRAAFAGDSYVAVVEFARPVRARALLTYGNWSQPGSPHRTDQLPLFARQELRPVWLAWPDIEAHTESREGL